MRKDRLIPADELALHRSRDDAWISVDGIVYDITPHIKNHYGWRDGPVTTVVAIMNALGRDATREWHEVGVHAERKPMAELRTYRIGVLQGGPLDPAVTAVTAPEQASVDHASSSHFPQSCVLRASGRTGVLQLGLRILPVGTTLLLAVLIAKRMAAQAGVVGLLSTVRHAGTPTS
mmetsp:Transcript_13821/g.37081  ORF Transcript_13821/g.37081 Transcript_13821/m.37081 type:complete len:176 (+) Transcript_13821:2333-2860(+)